MLVFAAFLKQIIRNKQVTKATIEKVNRLRDRVELSATTTQNIESMPKCILCLESRRDTCATVCGHLFCWPCIMDWLDQKEECPVCREKMKKSTIVYLMNLT